jgi:hypothetical protein
MRCKKLLAHELKFAKEIFRVDFVLVVTMSTT